MARSPGCYMVYLQKFPQIRTSDLNVWRTAVTSGLPPHRLCRGRMRARTSPNRQFDSSEMSQSLRLTHQGPSDSPGASPLRSYKLSDVPEGNLSAAFSLPRNSPPSSW